MATKKTPVTAPKIPKAETPTPDAAVESAVQPAAPESAAAPIVSKVLSVQASREGFRRAGRAWGKEATIVPLNELTEDQIEQLKSDPALTVAEFELSSQQAG